MIISFIILLRKIEFFTKYTLAKIKNVQSSSTSRFADVSKNEESY